ncbi:MAG: hypothetical protein GYB24_14130 [Rhodobacteraceae bacterium]|nr:hypothetical protein [Paracoccaceae bacterium]
MRRFSIIALLAAGLSLPLTATAQSRYTQNDRPVVETVQTKDHGKQIVSQGQPRHGNIGLNRRGGLQPEIVAISALAVLAAISLHHR